jgi:hypothetical protein
MGLFEGGTYLQILQEVGQNSTAHYLLLQGFGPSALCFWKSGG